MFVWQEKGYKHWNLEMKIWKLETYPKMEDKKAWNRTILVILGLVFLEKKWDRLKPTCFSELFEQVYIYAQNNL